ncbi:MAG TPA: NAD(P)-dependent oxidoreductase [Pyrinomonadaceae bacterium]|jgi:glutamate synthase (NADPH/NADH) small chain|nr:NAD(P)-dependent oxidoreductase [Pyrinomonadaceae bacterium]
MSITHHSPLDISQIEKNFAEINPALTEAEALHEANRCLYCFDAPCIHACPTHIDVPSFIKKIASGNLMGSARVIFDANPIGATCARVCPVEALCEGACVEKTLIDKPIEIGRLQRYATDYAMEKGRQIYEKGEPNGKSVAIIGSGPAGISCASYLSRLGYEVTVFERKPMAGGLDTYGMAEYKMPQKVSLDEVEHVKKMGVEFRTDTEIGKEIPVAALLADHDAVFLAVGLGSTNHLNIPGENLDGVYDALAFIEYVKTRDWKNVPLGKTVAVIGAGNTAVDAVTQAKRLGAEKVMMIYRRSQKDMPAYDYEYELAKKDEIKFHWNTVPVEVVGETTVTALRCRLNSSDETGETFDIPCEMVIKATGQQKMRGFLAAAGVETDEGGRVKVDPETMQTSNAQIFAGGDCVNGGREAVDASQMGKLAAQGIHLKLTGEKISFAGAKVPVVEKSPAH